MFSRFKILNTILYVSCCIIITNKTYGIDKIQYLYKMKSINNFKLEDYVQNLSLKGIKIYHCALYHNEAYPFAIKSIIYSPYITKFIYLYSDMSFSSKTNIKLNISPFEAIYQKLKSRIIIWKINRTNMNFYNAWRREEYFREQMNLALKSQGIMPDDFILLSDFDEIILEDGFDYIVQNKEKINFEKFDCNFFFYTFRWKRKEHWIHPIIVKYKVLEKKSNLELWNMKMQPIENIKGIHISYFFRNLETFKSKIQSFSHQEYNKYPYLNSNYLYSKIACGVDLYERKEVEMVEDSGFSEIKYPFMKSSQLNWMNKKIALLDLIGLDINETIKFNACDDSINFLKNLSSNG